MLYSDRLPDITYTVDSSGLTEGQSCRFWHPPCRSFCNSILRTLSTSLDSQLGLHRIGLWAKFHFRSAGEVSAAICAATKVLIARIGSIQRIVGPEYVSICIDVMQRLWITRRRHSSNRKMGHVRKSKVGLGCRTTEGSFKE